MGLRWAFGDVKGRREESGILGVELVGLSSHAIMMNCTISTE